MKPNDIKVKKENPKGMLAFRVYIPEDKKNIINKYISYAKLYKNNQVWEVMELAFKLLEEKENSEKHILEEIPERLLNFEQRLTIIENALESKQQEKEEESSEVSTFGGKQNE